MQIDKIGITLDVVVPEQAFTRYLPCSPYVIGNELARISDEYNREHELGYYPAIEFFKQVDEIDSDLIDSAEQVAWFASKLVRQEIQSRLRPVFSTVKIQSIQTLAFAMPAVRPNQPEALIALAQHYTPDTLKIELLLSMIRKDDDPRGDVAVAYARKMMFRWLKDSFESIEITSSKKM